MQLVSVVLQIILESLPISSSGHMQLLGASLPDYVDRLASGATSMVLLLYFFKDISWGMYYFFNNLKKIISFLLLIVMADSATVFFYTIFKKYAINFPLWCGFLITAVALISVRLSSEKKDRPVTYGAFLFLGVVQGFASLPGISRLASTYAAGCLIGFSPKISFGLSCALQFPLFIAGFLEGVATAYQKNILWTFHIFDIVFIMGAMLISYFLLWLVAYCMKKKMIWYVGWYLLIPALIAYMRGI